MRCGLQASSAVRRLLPTAPAAAQYAHVSDEYAATVRNACWRCRCCRPAGRQLHWKQRSMPTLSGGWGCKKAGYIMSIMMSLLQACKQLIAGGCCLVLYMMFTTKKAALQVAGCMKYAGSCTPPTCMHGVTLHHAAHVPSMHASSMKFRTGCILCAPNNTLLTTQTRQNVLTATAACVALLVVHACSA